MRFNITSCSAAFVGDVVVPAPVSAIVVVAENDCIFCQGTVACIFDIANSMELFADLSLDDLILFGLKVSCFKIKMQLVVSFVS